MTASVPTAPPRYVPPHGDASVAVAALVWLGHQGAERRYLFHDQIHIGRDDGAGDPPPGVLLVADPTVSRAHCTIRRAPDGRYFARDTSRNGIRLDGRRLVPNVEVEVRPGQTLALGSQYAFRLEGDRPPVAGIELAGQATLGAPGSSIATVLVGDIRSYTTLVRRASADRLQRSVNRVFDLLQAVVTEHLGTVKEYQGDAILAFWEGDFSGSQAVTACRAALALDARARAIASDPSVWELRDFPLEFDWAMATGPVLLDSLGRGRPTGLSLVGEPVVLAFRLEKFASEATGRILACRATREMAAGRFAFRELGAMLAKGFDRPDDVFALDGECPGSGRNRG